MDTITILKEELIDEIENGFVHAQFDVSKDLSHSNELYSDLCLENSMLVADYPIINEVLEGTGKIKLKTQAHFALQLYLNNQFWIDVEEKSEFYFRGFQECLEFLKQSGAIKQKFMDLDLSDMDDEHPSVLRDVFCDA